MGILISTAVLVGLYAAAVLIFGGVSSNLFDFPLPMLMVIGGSLLYSFVAFGPDLGPQSSARPRSPPPLRSPRKPAGSEDVVAFLIPRRGGKPVPPGSDKLIRAAGEAKLREHFGPDVRRILFLPAQWPEKPVGSAADFHDPVKRIGLAAGFAEALHGAGYSQPDIVAFAKSDLTAVDVEKFGLVLVWGWIPRLRREPGAALAVSPSSRSPQAATGPICDICGDSIPSGGMLRVGADRIRQLTTDGYLPTRLPPKMPAIGGADASGLGQAWRAAVSLNDTDWGVCKSCAAEIDRFAHGE